MIIILPTKQSFSQTLINEVGGREEKKMKKKGGKKKAF
jgi:hypothetical protein